VPRPISLDCITVPVGRRSGRNASELVPGAEDDRMILPKRSRLHGGADEGEGEGACGSITPQVSPHTNCRRHDPRRHALPYRRLKKPFSPTTSGIALRRLAFYFSKRIERQEEWMGVIRYSPTADVELQGVSREAGSSASPKWLLLHGSRAQAPVP